MKKKPAPPEKSTRKEPTLQMQPTQSVSARKVLAPPEVTLKTARAEDSKKEEVKKEEETKKEEKKEVETVEKSKTSEASIEPTFAKYNDKEQMIADGFRRDKTDYPTMEDIGSDWDDEKKKPQEVAS
uniref:Uncharacterized protein n=1 Tax=Caenorhabditis japonica TaxID=281687 RepID=A0A8R1E6V8_CAEJA